MNYGLRYEYYPLPVGDHFGTVRYDPSVRSTVTDSTGTHTVGTVLVGGENGVPNHAYTSNGWGLIVPRLGASYSANEKTVVRFGFGITDDPDTLRNLLQAYPAGIATSITGVNGYVPATSLNAGLLSPIAQVGIPAITIPNIAAGTLPLPSNLGTNTIPQNFRRGYIESDNLSIQRALPGRFTTTVAYVGTHAIRQQSSVDINASLPGGGNTGRLLNTTYGPNTSNTEITSLQPFRGSVYNGLQTQLTRMSERHTSTGIIYTYSKAMDASDNSEASGLVFAYPSYQNRDWALAGYDRKHNFQWWTVTNAPFGKGQKYLTHGVAGYVLGGWRVSTVLSRVSGTPFSVTDSGTYLNAPGNTQVADRNYAVTPVVHGRAYLPGITNGYQYINPLAFSSVTAATSSTPRFGSSGRDSVRGPGVFDLDASLKRSFPIKEGIALDFSADSFDVTNTPQFANPGTVGINSVSNQTNPTAAQLGGFGIITSSNVNRTLRFSGRISF